MISKLVQYVLSNWENINRMREDERSLHNILYSVAKHLYLVESGILSGEISLIILYREFYEPISSDERLNALFKKRFDMSVSDAYKIIAGEIARIYAR